MLLTGYADDAARAATDGTFLLLRKPVDGQQLADHLAALSMARQ